MLGYLLFAIAIVLIVILVPIAIIYNTFRSLFQRGDRLLKVTILLDQACNVIFGPLFNDVMIVEIGYEFGNPQDTISKVLGKNLALGNLSRTGNLLVKVLNFIDKNHVQKAASK